MSTQSDLTASAALANEMAAALEGTYPRARISILEPPEQVARGVFALQQERVESAAKAATEGSRFLSYLDRDEIRIKVLAECLATWQAESLDAKIAAWCKVHGSVQFNDGRCTLRSHSSVWSGQGDTSGKAFDAALKVYQADLKAYKEGQLGLPRL